MSAIRESIILAQRGFDQAMVSAPGKHFDFETDPKVDYPKGQYLADFLTDRAIEFIQRNHEAPFFLYLPHFGVHGPHEAKADLIAHFEKKVVQTNPGWRRTRQSDLCCYDRFGRRKCRSNPKNPRCASNSPTTPS